MRQMICKLHFHTAVRFGKEQGGSSLSGAGSTFRADVLFSALFQSLLTQGGAQELLSCVQEGRLIFSDAMPWKGEAIYVPKPVGIFAPASKRTAEDVSKRKLLKKIAFIPIDSLQAYLRGNADLARLYEANHFGVSFERIRVNQRDEDDPLPHRVGGFRFADDCGLYLIVSGDDMGIDLFAQGIQTLSAGGIGGKVSSGWGKFTYELHDVPCPLRVALEDESASRQMLLSTALPEESELSGALEDAFYVVVRRGGFTSSDQVSPLKKRTVYLLGAGSTFCRRFAGSMMDVGMGMPHPVWRYARGMFMGVNV